MQNVAVITGASSGIGRSLSIQLSQAGYQIVIAARSENKLNSICDEINEQGGSCIAIPTDVSKPNDIIRLKNQSMEYGNISVVINNAGMGKFGPIEDVTLEDWDTQMNVNLRGAFLVSQAFVPELKKNNAGCLVFINSVAGIQPFSHSAVYVASKYGMRGLSASMREELREFNIKVISVHPGAVNTPFWDGIQGDFPREDMLDADELAASIIHSVKARGNLTIEEMVIRRVAGDF